MGKFKRNKIEGLCMLSKFPTPEAASQALMHIYSNILLFKQKMREG